MLESNLIVALKNKTVMTPEFLTVSKMAKLLGIPRRDIVEMALDTINYENSKTL
jgi:hypothetical protein